MIKYYYLIELKNNKSRITLAAIGTLARGVVDSRYIGLRYIGLIPVLFGILLIPPSNISKLLKPP